MSEDEQENLEIELYELAQRHRDLVKDAAAALVARDRVVLRLVDDSPMPDGAVAELAGVSRAQVHRIKCNPALYDN